ncbi:protein of unknown function [Ralstonia solanacearum PSI07]|nr:protein of unknown function [Ralstonia solanacearum PSI07]
MCSTRAGCAWSWESRCGSRSRSVRAGASCGWGGFLTLPVVAGWRMSFPGVWDAGNQPMFHEPRTGAEWNL